MDDLVSVIIPVYKAEKYLRRCLESVRNQTHQNIEVILVDDGSPDKCPQICDEYAAEDLRFHVVHKENGGVSSARNAGLDYCAKSAGGGYICFVDADDYLDVNYIEYLLNMVIDNSCDIGNVGHFTIRDNKILEDEKRKDSIQIIAMNNYRFDAEYAHIVVWGAIFSRKLIINNKIRFQNNMIRCEDFLFIAEALKKAKRIAASSKQLYYYTDDNFNSLRRSVDAEKIVFSLNLLHSKMKQLFKNTNRLVYQSYFRWIPVNYVAMMNAFCDKNQFSGKMYRKAKCMIISHFSMIMFSKSPYKYKIRLVICAFSPRIYSLIRRKMKEKMV